MRKEEIQLGWKIWVVLGWMCAVQASASLSPLGTSGSRFTLSAQGASQYGYTLVISLKGQSRGSFFQPGPFGLGIDFSSRTGFFLFGDVPSRAGPFDTSTELSLGFGTRILISREKQKVPAVGIGAYIKKIGGNTDGEIRTIVSKIIKTNELIGNLGYSYERDSALSAHHFLFLSMLWRRFITSRWEVLGEGAFWISKNLVFALSTGGQFFLTKRFSIMLSAEAHYGGNAVDGSTVISLAYRTYDERRRDSDGDGIFNFQDRCPFQPEDRDGFEDSDGCPDPDNDGDGIPDALDPTPNGESPQNRHFEKSYPTFKLRIL